MEAELEFLIKRNQEIKLKAKEQDAFLKEYTSRLGIESIDIGEDIYRADDILQKDIEGKFQAFDALKIRERYGRSSAIKDDAGNIQELGLDRPDRKLLDAIESLQALKRELEDYSAP